MKNKPPVFEDQKTIKEKEKEIQREHIKALKIINKELKNLCYADYFILL